MEDITTEAVDTGTSEDIKKQIEAEQSSGTLSDQTEDVGSSDEVEEEPTETKEEWLLPGRFRKNEVDKLAEAYRHAESYNSRLANEIYQLKRALEGQEKTQKRNSDIDTEEFKKRALENPVEAISYVVEKKLAVDKEVQKADTFKGYYYEMKKNKEFAELEPVMVNLVNENIDLIEAHNLRDNPRVLDLLYLAAKGITTEQKRDQVIEEGKKMGEKETLKKVKAQVEGGSSSKANNIIDPYKIPLDELKKRINKTI